MTIGSHCIKGFSNVDPFIELIKKRNEETLRNALRNWIKPTCNQIWTDKRLAKRIYRKDGVEKILPKKKFIDYYNLLRTIDVDSISFITLKTIFRKVDKLEFIELPEYVEDIIHPRLVKTKKHSGLDEFFWN